jgi:IS30 family transposase
MNKKGSKHIRWEQRLTIERMLKQNFSKVDIAKAIGMSERSVYYEIKRGMCLQQINECDFEERYCPEVAERKYQDNLRAKGPDLKIGKDHALANFIEDKIVNEHFSPGAVLHLIVEEDLHFDTRICVSTLYNYIYRGDVFLMVTKEHLLYKGERKVYSQEDRNRAREAKGDSIEKRPKEIKERNSFGHWEMDSVMGTVGSNRALLVLTERLTRHGIVIPVPDHTAASVVRALNRLERQWGRRFYAVFKSITVDNGCEFQDCTGMEKSCRRKSGKRTKIYYCHPSSPHERGSNENMNRIIRRFFPKGTNFDLVDNADIRRAEDWMNHYPRKVLGWKSSAALFGSYLAA